MVILARRPSPWKRRRSDAGGRAKPDWHSGQRVTCNRKAAVDLVHAPLGYATHAITEAFNGDRADLFRLGLRVSPQTAIAGRQPDLEGIHAANVAGYWHDRNHAAVRR